jgi:hypothetical protein
MITPIGKEGTEVRKNADEVMEYIINPVCQEFGYSVVRADTMANSGLITKAIIEQIISADLVIADLTGNNPNVFYELAIRHSYRKPAIQIIKGDTEIPFDVSNMRTILYETTLSGADSAKKEIEAMLKAIENGEIVQNPVSEVSTLLNLSENSTEENAEILSTLLLEVQQIPDNLKALENNIETRFSQMLSAFIETIRNEQVGSSIKPEDRMLEMFMNKLFENPQKGMQSFDALMKLQEKIDKSSSEQK